MRIITFNGAWFLLKDQHSGHLYVNNNKQQQDAKEIPRSEFVVVCDCISHRVIYSDAYVKTFVFVFQVYLFVFALCLLVMETPSLPPISGWF